MPNAKDIYEKWYKGEDFAGAPVTAKIAKIDMEVMKGFNGEDTIKLVFTLENHARRIVLGKLMSRKLTAEWGDDYDQWVGRVVAIDSLPMVVAGKEVLAIRLTPAPDLKVNTG